VVFKDAKGKNGKGSGTLVVNGVSKTYPFTYVEQDGGVLAQFNAKLSDFKIKDVKHLGVGVNDPFKVEALIPSR
jgi:hypothetical protein